MAKQHSSWLRKFITGIMRKPSHREQLIEQLHDSAKLDVLDQDALSMMESVLQIRDMQVRDIMIPRAQMALIKKNISLAEIVKIIADSNHSRYPVTDEDGEEVEGILLAKDLLPYAFDHSLKFNLRDLLRPTLFVPESKRLNVLLKEFRNTKNHMAVVVDEYGGVSGVVTLEDVLEQIVGEIEDEYDIDPENLIKQLEENTYTVKAFTPIDEFNDHFAVALNKDDCDTIGGLVVKHFGHLPQRGESIRIKNYTFTILHADSRRVRMLELKVD